MQSQTRANQLVKAQNEFRGRMRDNGYQRLQEWIPEHAVEQLGQLCTEWGLSRREAIEGLIAAAKSGKIKLQGKRDDDRQ